ncbi:spermidine synthase [bacterium]|nr:spermidine synthase [bacterium]
MVYLLFFLSGCAGLIYEIAWSRQLGLFFGHTVHAAAVVLAAYFAGMALGYWLAGSWAGRLKRPLSGYGAAELVVAAWAVATPHLLNSFTQPQLAGLLNHPNPDVQLAVRAVVTFFALLPATIALGATLPFIAEHVSAAARGLSAQRIALAYGLNTAGAFCGVLLATFVLILNIGVAGSGYFAALLSAGCGLAALWLARRKPVDRVEALADALRPSKPAEQNAVSPALAGPQARLTPSWYVLAGLSGWGMLGLQVLFTRLFAMTFHNSTYTFGGVVAVFLIALAGGSWLVARFAGRYPPAPWAAITCSAGAPAILLGVFIFQRFTRLGYFDAGPGFAIYILAALGLIALVVLLPVLLLGTVLPYCFAAAPSGAHGAGAAVGRLTAVNTLSATAGSLITSFWLLPTAGLWNSFAIYAVLYAVLGIVILGGRYSAGRLALPALGLVLLVAAGIVTTQWPLSVVGKSSRLIYERETPYGLITVTQQEAGDLWMKQNNHYVLGATVGADSELRQGNLPLLLHPNPRQVCFLGLATGITAGAALDHREVEQAVAVELIPEVADAAALFAPYNNSVLADARAEVVINDARHYLYAADRRFDVIVSDLFVPWHSQTGYLYTVEHYRAARERLAPGGLFCQWLPLYQVGPAEFELIADSFSAVFPVTTIWRGELDAKAPLIAFIGSEEPLQLDASELTARVGRLPLPWCGRDPVITRGTDIPQLFVGQWHLRQSAPLSIAWLNTDNFPRVEFLAPITRQARIKLTGRQLADYYDNVLLQLPLTGLAWTPRPHEPAPDLGSGRSLQRQWLDRTQ